MRGRLSNIQLNRISNLIHDNIPSLTRDECQHCLLIHRIASVWWRRLGICPYVCWRGDTTETRAWPWRAATTYWEALTPCPGKVQVTAAQTCCDLITSSPNFAICALSSRGFTHVACDYCSIVATAEGNNGHDVLKAYSFTSWKAAFKQCYTTDCTEEHFSFIMNCLLDVLTFGCSPVSLCLHKSGTFTQSYVMGKALIHCMSNLLVCTGWSSLTLTLSQLRHVSVECDWLLRHNVSQNTFQSLVLQCVASTRILYAVIFLSGTCISSPRWFNRFFHIKSFCYKAQKHSHLCHASHGSRTHTHHWW